MLNFDWEVSSESGYDMLMVYWNNDIILRKSGIDSGSFEYLYASDETGTLRFEYIKDASENKNEDRAWISNVKMTKPEGFYISQIDTPNSHSLDKNLCNPGDEVWCEIKLYK